MKLDPYDHASRLIYERQVKTKEKLNDHRDARQNPCRNCT